MKSVIATSIAIALIAGYASAAPALNLERPDNQIVLSKGSLNLQVPAGSLYISKELKGLGLLANSIIEVTQFPSSNFIEPTGRDD